MKTMFTPSVLALGGLAAGILLYSMRTLAAQNAHPAEYRFSGPYTHDNLTIFLIHGASRSGKSLLTLEEAIDQHKVIVYETHNVNELAVENVSMEDVFIQSGDIVKGGAQDRTLKDDLILPAKSGKVNLNAFCVEHGRWSRRGTEAYNTFGGSRDAIASKQLKMAVKMKQNQRSIDGYLQELSGIINGKTDVIGYAFAIDGKLNSADVYSSHELFAKLWMKLLRADAVEAVASYQEGKKPEAVGINAVKAALADAESGKPSVNKINERTEVIVRETAQNVMFETRDRAANDAWIHRNYLTK